MPYMRRNARLKKFKGVTPVSQPYNLMDKSQQLGVPCIYKLDSMSKSVKIFLFYRVLHSKSQYANIKTITV